MEGPHLHPRAYAWLLVILVLLCGFAYALYLFGRGGQAPAQQTPPPSVVASIPPPTAADYVAAQQPFNYLVSYTVSGLHPTTLAISVGQTVRFTDNDPEGSLTIQGASTSPALSQGEYWQYTATKAGTVTFTAGNSTLNVTVAE